MRRVIFALLLLGNSLFPSPSKTEKLKDVDVILVLALDSSGSVNDHRWEIQRQGYAAAFTSQELLQAIRKGPVGAIAVTVVAWSSLHQQHVIVGWHVVEDATSAKAFSTRILEMPRPYRGGTSIAGGIMYSVSLIRRATFRAHRKVIDISGDGRNEMDLFLPPRVPLVFITLQQARNEALLSNITINALALEGNEEGITEYFRDFVICGPGSFVIPVEDTSNYPSFAEAIRKKLITEIAQR
jgi:hypothetical protein